MTRIEKKITESKRRKQLKKEKKKTETITKKV